MKLVQILKLPRDRREAEWEPCIVDLVNSLWTMDKFEEYVLWRDEKEMMWALAQQDEEDEHEATQSFHDFDEDEAESAAAVRDPWPEGPAFQASQRKIDEFMEEKGE